MGGTEISKRVNRLMGKDGYKSSDVCPESVNDGEGKQFNSYKLSVVGPLYSIIL